MMQKSRPSARGAAAARSARGLAFRTRLDEHRMKTAAHFLLLLLTAAAFAHPKPSQPQPRVDRPNFIVILIDDLGYGDIGPFGSAINKTPHLNRMAREGMKLTSFYVPAPVCTPTRAALLTGSYPKRVGLARGSRHAVLLPADPWGLHPGEVTIAEILQQQGYATACFGKWHLGDQPPFMPNQQGFDEYYGLPYSNDMWPHHPDNDRYGFPPLPILRNSEVAGWVDDMQDQSELARLFTEQAVGFIRRHRDQPFFLYLPHAFIHHPRGAREPFLRQAQQAREGKGAIDWEAVRQAPWDVELPWRTRAQIEEIDWSVGEILQTLRDLDLGRKTLVVFTSDNGGARGSVNHPLRGAKGSTWEGGMRVPALAWWPGQVPAGSVSGQLVTAMDLLPTFGQLSQAQVPKDRIIDGKDISAVLTGQTGATSPHEAFYYYRGNALKAVRSGHWKLFRATGALYDLDSDIGESTDVAPDHPEVVARLEGLVEQALADLGDGASHCPRCRPVGVVEQPRAIAAGNR